jgi:hypothetical protein
LQYDTAKAAVAGATQGLAADISTQLIDRLANIAAG